MYIDGFSYLCISCFHFLIEDYEDSLDTYNPGIEDEPALNTYGKQPNSDLPSYDSDIVSAKTNQFPISNTYSIDNGFGQEPQYSYKG